MALEFNFWNVEHGSAALVETPNDKKIAIDLGASHDGGVFSSPLKLLQRLGIKKLDHVTITHPHLDHIDDILNLHDLNPTTVTLPSHLTEEDIRGGNYQLNADAEAKVRKYLEISGRYVGDPRTAERLDIPPNWGGVSIRSFVPYLSSHSNLNNHSVVTTFEYNNVKVLVPGDNESASWAELLKRPDFVSTISNTDVFVASHHGRESGFYAPLFDHFNPLISIISDGPVVGTSVTGKYTELTMGWRVKKRSGGSETRKCVTTRNDGCITVGGRWYSRKANP